MSLRLQINPRQATGHVSALKISTLESNEVAVWNTRSRAFRVCLLVDMRQPQLGRPQLTGETSRPAAAVTVLVRSFSSCQAIAYGSPCTTVCTMSASHQPRLQDLIQPYIVQSSFLQCVMQD